jgi:cell division protein FtsB
MEYSSDLAAATHMVNMGSMRLLLDTCKDLIVRVEMCHAKIAEQQRQIDALQAQIQALQPQAQTLQPQEQLQEQLQEQPQS